MVINNINKDPSEKSLCKSSYIVLNLTCIGNGAIKVKILRLYVIIYTCLYFSDDKVLVLGPLFTDSSFVSIRFVVV